MYLNKYLVLAYLLYATITLSFTDPNTVCNMVCVWQGRDTM